MVKKMTHNVVIFGAGQRARELKRLLAMDGTTVDYFVIDAEFIDSDTFDGVKVISTDRFLSEFSPETSDIYLGVGMPKMNKIRERLFDLFHSKGFTFDSYISPYSNILTDSLGEGNTVFAGVNIAPGVVIGDANHFEMGVTISHDCTIGDFNFFAPGCTLCGNITIGRGNFIGANCTVKNSVKINDYVLVGAGSYVDMDIPTGKVIVPQKSHILINKTSDYFINR